MHQRAFNRVQTTFTRKRTALAGAALSAVGTVAAGLMTLLLTPLVRTGSALLTPGSTAPVHVLPTHWRAGSSFGTGGRVVTGLGAGIVVGGLAVTGGIVGVCGGVTGTGGGVAEGGVVGGGLDVGGGSKIDGIVGG